MNGRRGLDGLNRVLVAELDHVLDITPPVGDQGASQT